MLVNGEVEIPIDTKIGLQVGRTLMIMQTKIVDRPELRVGDYMKEKCDMGYRQYLVHRDKARKQPKKRNSEPNFNLD